MSEALKTALDQIHEEFKSTTEEGANKQGDFFEAAVVELLGSDKKQWRTKLGLQKDFPSLFIGAGTNPALRPMFESQWRTAMLTQKLALESNDDTSYEEAKVAGGAMSFVFGFLVAKNLYEGGAKK